MILVAGATGFLGREICRRLAADGLLVRALVRATSDPDALRQLQEWGVEAVVGDLRDPASLAAACQGVHGVISTVTTVRSRQPGDDFGATDQQGQLNLVDAAEAAGVRRFLYISYSGNVVSDDPLTRAKRAVEQRLRSSRLTYTIVRPSLFMEVWLSPLLGFDFPNTRAVVYGSGDQPISWISQADVAAFAVHCLHRAAAENATVELGGPEALSPLQAVRIFEQVGGRRFEVQRVPEVALRARKAAAPDAMSEVFAALTLAYAAGDPIPMAETLRTYPLRLRTVREHAQRVSAAVVPDPAVH